MKVINLNSKYELSDGHLAFAERLVRSLSCRREPDDRLGQLVDDIPVFLVDDTWMTKHRDDAKGTERLGFYDSQSPILGVKRPVIGLCPERIMKSAALDGPLTDNQITWLVGKVLIHELAHALMDVPTQLHLAEPEFYRYMEESMANVITIEAFEALGHAYRYRRDPVDILSGPGTSALSYVRKFISAQPLEYRLAITLRENHLGRWRRWSRLKRDYPDRTSLQSAHIEELICVVKADPIDPGKLKASIETLL